MVRRVFPRRALPWWQGLLLASGATVSAWLLRSALDPVLRDQMPYTLFFTAVLVASIFGGWKAGVTATILSALAANASFVSHDDWLMFEGSRGWGFAIFVLVALVLVSLVHTLADTLRRETDLREELTTVSGEYRHRIKNLLTVCQSLLHQTARTATSIHELRDKATDRLHALARAQDLLHVGTVQAAPLNALVDKVLKPYHLERRLAWPISGPDVLAPADATIALALLLNELATNATKYGALSVEEGRLKLGWSVQGEWTVIEWKEIDGPHVTPPTKAGFGSRLFESALTRATGSAELFYEPSGLRCEIKLRCSASPSVGTTPKLPRGKAAPSKWPT